MYQFDGKVWTTLYLLIRRPGFLTNEFNAGKISSYVHPLRLFMFISCLFFLFFFALIPEDPGKAGITINNGEGLSTYVQTENGVINIPMNQYAIDYWNDELSDKERMVAQDTTIWICGKTVAETKLQSIARWEETPYGDTLRGEVPKILLDKNFILPIHARDTVYALSSDTTFFNSSWLPIILLLLIPVFALLLKFFFRKEKMSYMKHYAFALHLHSVMLLAVSVVLLWFYFVSTDFASKIAEGMSVLLFLYMVVAANRVYTKTHWAIKIIRSLAVYLIYMICLFCVFVGTLLWCAVKLFDVDLGNYL